MKVHAYRMNEIWLTDVDYMDKIAKYENGVKYLLIVVTVLSRFLTKTPTDTTRAFKRKTTKKIPE